ncbi:uncharacterized protein LOC114329596 [Diabrotica virgifera virgifera]|uniref:Uncharacterized protein LOC114329596 n=1 Tax=Diabrotica virgifera virgifera TaxID=50390 RepID=A0A6P7FFH4_DIAVI|nr:uncharacterized protein LOC114329596 [Diabrotica virgifera virgifera]
MTDESKNVEVHNHYHIYPKINLNFHIFGNNGVGFSMPAEQFIKPMLNNLPSSETVTKALKDGSSIVASGSSSSYNWLRGNTGYITNTVKSGSGMIASGTSASYNWLFKGSK